MDLRPLQILVFLQCGDRLYASESDVYRRQIMTIEVDPRAIRVNHLTADPDYIRFCHFS